MLEEVEACADRSNLTLFPLGIDDHREALEVEPLEDLLRVGAEHDDPAGHRPSAHDVEHMTEQRSAAPRSQPARVSEALARLGRKEQGRRELAVV